MKTPINLRALQFVRGEVAQVVNLRSFDPESEQSQINNLRYSIPWLDQIDLLVLDGFFDFTPVQGEILKYLIPRIPNVIVNLNHDDAERGNLSTVCVDHRTSAVDRAV